MKINRSPRGYWLFLLLAASFLAFTLDFTPAKAQSNSQVRIVRLSFVEGTVKMYRPDADQWAQAFVNTPIQQGFKIATDANSFAEVEFENGSTVRLGQLSELDFTRLALSPEGGKINNLALAQGYATFAFTPDKTDVYKVGVAGSNFDVSSQSMFRLDLDKESQRLEVFKGAVSVQSPYGSETVAQNQMFEVAAGGTNPPQITNGITEDDWDRWVDKRQQTTAVAMNKSGPGDSSLNAGSSLYGWSDLSYYGTWNYLPGMGSCWSPMMGAGWTPYSIGRWSWYPGFGYTWISGLSWGWLPFHYGSWVYPADMGWCWMPGGFSNWSPALVTWYQGPGWVSWAPRTYTGTYNKPLNCPSGQNCSVAVNSNTFQGGGAISPGDVIRVRPVTGRVVGSPTIPLTRNLRLPGPAVDGSGLVATSGSAGAAATLRGRRIVAAPTRVFSQSAIRGTWDVQPHAPAVFNQQTGRFVNGSGPVINNDMLLRSRRGMSPANKAGLAPIPVSDLGVHNGTMRHSGSLMPTAQAAENAAIHTSQPQPMPNFREERRMVKQQQRMERQQARREMQMERQSGIRQQHTVRSAAPQHSSGGFGASQESGRSSGQMSGGIRESSGMGGGIRGGSPSGMGGGSGGGGSQHGPPR
ncbi:MAG TPA: FecR family protein [Terriglobia bacterium]|nr:FecR family protein [Terriglobia bacterium]